MTETPPIAADETPSAVRRLTRPREGRMLAGVCAGLGRYFDLSPAIYRLAFVVLALAGGTGILLYIAAWLVIPVEGSEASIAEEALRNHRDRPGLAVGVGLVALALIIGVSHASFWPHPGNLWLAALLVGGGLVWWELSGRRGRVPATAEGPPPSVPARARPRSLFGPVVGVLLAAAGILGLLSVLDVPLFDLRIALAGAVFVVGAAVAASAFMHTSLAGLIGLGILLVLAMTLAIAVHVPLHGGVGDRVFEPATATQLQQRYRRSIGSLTIDLRDTSFPSGVRRVKATLGIGDLRIHVPDDVNVVVHAKAQAGELQILGHRENGWDIETIVRENAVGSDKTLIVDAEVGLGDVGVDRG